MTSIMEVLGDELANLLNIKPIQAKGLLRLSIRDVMPGQLAEDLTLNNLTGVLKEGLKGRLDRIGASNSDMIVKKMVNFATKKQSLITILRT